MELSGADVTDPDQDFEVQTCSVSKITGPAEPAGEGAYDWVIDYLIEVEAKDLM